MKNVYKQCQFNIVLSSLAYTQREICVSRAVCIEEISLIR